MLFAKYCMVIHKKGKVKMIVRYKLIIMVGIITFTVFSYSYAFDTKPPILEYRFNETGTYLINSGSCVIDPVVLRTFDSNRKLIDLHSGTGFGVSGVLNDKALDNTSSGIGQNNTGRAALSVPTGIFEIHGLQSFTLSGWFKTKKSLRLENNATLISHYDNGQGFVLDVPQQGQLCLTVDNMKVQSPIGAYAVVDEWVFFAVTYDGTRSTENVNFYVGLKNSPVSEVTKPLTMDAGVVDTNAFFMAENFDRFVIGNYRTSYNRPFKGYLDNIRIFGSKTDASGVLLQEHLEEIRREDVAGHTVNHSSKSEQRIVSYEIKNTKIIRREQGAWLATPNPWSKMPVEIREELHPGRPLLSEQISDSPFGAQLATMDDRIEADRISFVLDQFAATGMKWIRDGAVVGLNDGETVEQAKEQWKKIPEYWFDFCKESTDRKIKLLITIRVVMPGGKKVTGSGELGRTALVEWCKIIVPTLKSWVKDWEIDNEPNPEISPAEYVAAVKVAYKTIKDIDPEARVHAGVLSSLESLASAARGGKEPYPDPNSCYVDGLLQAGLLNVCDVFSIHTYRWGTWGITANIPEHASEMPMWEKWSDYIAQIKELKDRLHQASGRDFPISITEFGYGTWFAKPGGEYPAIFEAKPDQRLLSQQSGAKYELRAAVMDHYLGIYPIMKFAFKRQTHGFYDFEAHWGMVSPDWIRMPSYFAYMGLCSLLDSRDMPLDVPVNWPNVSNSKLFRTYAFYRQQKLYLTFWDTIRPGAAVPKRRYIEPLEIITIATWQAIPTSQQKSVVETKVELVLPDEYYGYPILVDPMNLFCDSYQQLSYTQSGNIYVIDKLPLSDSPQMICFFKLKSKETK